MAAEIRGAMTTSGCAPREVSWASFKTLLGTVEQRSFAENCALVEVSITAHDSFIAASDEPSAR